MAGVMPLYDKAGNNTNEDDSNYSTTNCPNYNCSVVLRKRFWSKTQKYNINIFVLFVSRHAPSKIPVDCSQRFAQKAF